jgi:hypothetical protein
LFSKLFFRPAIILAAGFFLGIGCFHTSLEARCREELAQLGEPAAYSHLKIQTEVLVDSYAQFVKKNKRSPSLKEFADGLEITQASLKRYFALQKTASSMAEIATEAMLQRPEVFDAVRKEYAKNLSVFYKRHMRAPDPEERQSLTKLSKADLALFFQPDRGDFWIIDNYFPKDSEILRSSVSRAFARVARETGRMPEVLELATALEIDLAQLSSLIAKDALFESWEELKHHSMRNFELSFKAVIDTDYYSLERIEQSVVALQSRKRRIYTTASAGKPVDKDFLAALLTMQRKWMLTFSYIRRT